MAPLDDEYRFIVDEVALTARPSLIVLPLRILQYGAADVPGRESAVVSHQLFELMAVFLVAPVINSVGI